MPERLIKPALLYLSPSAMPTVPILAVQIAVSITLAWISAGFAWIAGLPISAQVFFWAMAADYISGLYACGQGDGGFWVSFQWRIGVAGIFRKALIGVIALILWKICGLVGPSAELLAAGITYLCAINEGASVVANLRKGKFEVPAIADEVLLRARRQFEAKEELLRGRAPIETKKEGQ
jgi:phage-related holin